MQQIIRIILYLEQIYPDSHFNNWTPELVSDIQNISFLENRFTVIRMIQLKFQNIFPSIPLKRKRGVQRQNPKTETCTVLSSHERNWDNVKA